MFLFLLSLAVIFFFFERLRTVRKECRTGFGMVIKAVCMGHRLRPSLLTYIQIYIAFVFCINDGAPARLTRSTVDIYCDFFVQNGLMGRYWDCIS